MSEIAYPELGLAEDLAKEILWDNLMEAFAASIAFGFLTPLVRYFVLKMGDRLFLFLRQQIDMTAIPIVNAINRKAFDSEMIRLKAIALSEGINSPKFLEARKNAKEAFRKQTQYGPLSHS